MKRNFKIFKHKLSAIEKITWYRQRFDACPHFMFFLGDAHISNSQHTKYPFGQRIAYAGFSKNRADWYHGLAELDYTAARIIKAAKKNPRVSQQMIRAFLPWQKNFYKACGSINDKNLSKLSGQELLKTYDNLAGIYTNKLNSSPLIDGFALSTDKIIAEKIKDFLESKKLGRQFVEYFSRLTAPVYLSFLQEEEIALLNIARKIKNNPGLKKRLLEQHQKNYFWIRNNYVTDHVESVKAFEKRLADFKKNKPEDKIKELESLAKNHQKDKAALMDALELPKEIRVLLAITDDFNAWQDERKKGTFWATHYFSLLLEEFARRTKYSVKQLKYALPPEMPDILLEKLDVSELEKRIEYCMIIWILDNYDVTTDKNLIAKLDKIGIGEFSVVAEVGGFVASRGKAVGRARIIMSVEEIKKVKQNDIIIAVMTRPDYLPAMKKAAAFVTDEGGITCHAAIVAREMKKPCIIGTKIATQVFKDGDRVEVDANHGWVRKL